MNKFELQFENELRDKMLRAKRECKYNPTRFNQMLAQYGGVGTAKRLIASGIATGTTSDGYASLNIGIYLQWKRCIIAIVFWGQNNGIYNNRSGRSTHIGLQ